MKNTLKNDLHSRINNNAEYKRLTGNGKYQIIKTGYFTMEIRSSRQQKLENLKYAIVILIIFLLIAYAIFVHFTY